MNGRRVPVAVLVVLVFLAGCSAVADAPGGGSDAPARTVTPAPVPTDDPDAGGLAPGVRNRVVVDPGVLASAHSRYLSRRRYTERSLTVVTFRGNETVLGARRLLVRRGESAYRIEYDLTGAPRTEVRSFETVAASAWSNGTLVAEAVTDRAGTTEYSVTAGLPSPGPTAPDARLYARLLAESGASVVSSEERNGTTYYRLRATVSTPPSTFGLRGSAPTGPGTLRAVVSEDGLLRRVDLSYPATYRGRLVTLRHRFEYTEIGETTVSRPDWLEEAFASEETPTNDTRTTPGE